MIRHATQAGATMCATVLAGLMAGCMSPRVTEVPEVTYEPGWASSGAETGAVHRTWWTTFDDPVLSDLLARAAEHNHDVRAAAARVREARARKRAAASGWWPDLGAGAGVERRSAGEHAPNGLAALAERGFASLEQDVYNAGFDASWELDLFGRTRARAEAATEGVRVRHYERRDVVLTVLGEVGRTYFEVRGARARLHALRDRVRAAGERVDLLKQQQAIGLVGDIEVERARTRLEQARARLPELAATIRAGLYQLAVLVGEEPGAVEDEMADDPGRAAPPPSVPVGLRSELLTRRPDVRAAEARVRAAIARRKAAQADWFPRFSLTGSFGRQGLSFDDLLVSAGRTWTLGGVVEWPVFRGGEIRAGIEAADARAEQAALRYEQAVLRVLADVESGLVAYGQAVQARNRLAAAETSARHAVELTRELDETGLRSRLDVLKAEAEWAGIRADLEAARTEVLRRLVALYKALGGGWAADSPEG